MRIDMMRKTTVATTLTTLAVMTLTASSGAYAHTGRELAGLDTCLTASEKQLDGLEASSDYYFARTAHANQYYINGTALQSGKRIDVQISCETSRNGRALLSQSSSAGHFAQDPTATAIEIADK
jgi:hypothetical protein